MPLYQLKTKLLHTVINQLTNLTITFITGGMKNAKRIFNNTNDEERLFNVKA
jgi:hypothetical protein